jgi:hypothetical protein
MLIKGHHGGANRFRDKVALVTGGGRGLGEVGGPGYTATNHALVLSGSNFQLVKPTKLDQATGSIAVATK